MAGANYDILNQDNTIGVKFRGFNYCWGSNEEVSKGGDQITGVKLRGIKWREIKCRGVFTSKVITQ